MLNTSKNNDFIQIVFHIFKVNRKENNLLKVTQRNINHLSRTQEERKDILHRGSVTQSKLHRKMLSFFLQKYQKVNSYKIKPALVTTSFKPWLVLHGIYFNFPSPEILATSLDESRTHRFQLGLTVQFIHVPYKWFFSCVPNFRLIRDSHRSAKKRIA